MISSRPPESIPAPPTRKELEDYWYGIVPGGQFARVHKKKRNLEVYYWGGEGSWGASVMHELKDFTFKP